MKTYMFPGQGSQVKGMGGTLFDEFKELIDKADNILGYSIKELCLEDPKRRLHQTQFTQPALYVANALSYFKKMDETKQPPDYLCGHSLGEYNALLASGAFDFETGLKMVKKRGELMSQASGGGMAAVLGMTEDKIREILTRNNLSEIDVANINTPLQIVLSGRKEDINQAQAFFEMDDVNYVPLNVSAAFHSRYMQAAKEEYESFIKNFTFSELTIPVISNVYAEPYEQDKIVANLGDQLRSSVRWSETLWYLVQKGNMAFEEVGVGEVLTKMHDKFQSQIAHFEQKEDSTPPATDEPLVTEKPANAPAPGKTDFEKEAENLEAKVANWNKTYVIGTKVKVEGYEELLETRTEAMILFGHRAAIYMKGYNGYFALDEVAPA